jgi:trehalose 6-phosphate synthase/phosphatase
MAKTIIVSNRLPVKIQKKDDFILYKPSEGGLATGLGSVYKEGHNVWIGWPGLSMEDPEERNIVIEDLEKENMRPVFLNEEEIKGFYEGFSNGTLWPTFHYFSQYAIYKQRHWESYKRVNQRYCDEIIKCAEPDDTIWIHDYQLLLLPQMLRKHLPDITIGFFQHIPFPSFEVFRLLPWRKELLHGMLGADLIGFHTYDDTRHFLSAVNRIAGKSNLHGKIQIDNRSVVVDSFPMGIDYDRYAEAAAAPETIGREVRYRAAIQNQKLFLSVDRLDYSKGIPQRLKAFERFLSQHPEYIEKVALLMVVVPSRDKVGKYKELKEEIDEMVGRINGKYGAMNWNPIHYFYRSFPLHALSAFYRMADIALVTPMRDGMNLVCKEFIASKLEKKGVLILSEMAGASKELSDAILINPNDITQMTEAIHKALDMPEDEQVRHMDNMQRTIKRYNIHHWVKMFMSRLKLIKEQQLKSKTRIVDQESIEEIAADYKKAEKRLIFLDYDGTLVSFVDNPNDAKPDAELRAMLKQLTDDKTNRVVIISGREKATLQTWFKDLPVDLIAEHGVWMRQNGEGWNMAENLDNEWKDEIRSVLELYVDRTPGSFIEEKDFSLVWHYRKVETGLGELRTRELTSHLNYLAHSTNLQVLEGNMVVEIKNGQVNKGKAAAQWIKKFPTDFTIAIGDDWTDEDTFKAMPDEAYTVKVGSSSTAAKLRMGSPQEVRKLIKTIIQASFPRETDEEEEGMIKNIKMIDINNE